MAPCGHPLALRANASALSLHSWHARAARMGRGRAAWGDMVRPAGCRVRGAVRSGGAWSPGARTLFSRAAHRRSYLKWVYIDRMRPGVPAHDRDISPVTYDGRRRCHNSRMFYDIDRPARHTAHTHDTGVCLDRGELGPKSDLFNSCRALIIRTRRTERLTWRAPRMESHSTRARPAPSGPSACTWLPRRCTPHAGRTGSRKGKG